MADRGSSLNVLRGQHVVVHKVDGTKEEGIFDTVSFATEGTEFSIVIKAANALVAGKEVSGYRSVSIDASSVVQVVVASIVLKESDARGGRDGFATDTDISASAAILNERELVDVDNAWLDSDTAVNLEDQEMESGKAWDQFEANYKLTGRVATYDENFYTTRLDMSKVGRLARKKDD